MLGLHNDMSVSCRHPQVMYSSTGISIQFKGNLLIWNILFSRRHQEKPISQTDKQTYRQTLACHFSQQPIRLIWLYNQWELKESLTFTWSANALARLIGGSTSKASHEASKSRCKTLGVAETVLPHQFHPPRRAADQLRFAPLLSALG